MRINKILLVGGTGYIGMALYQKLKNNYSVHLTGRVSKSEFGDDFRKLDFANLSSIKKTLGKDKYDLVIILAAQKVIRTTGEIDFGNNIFKDNIINFNVFLKYLFKLQDQAAVIFFSSMTVYDPLAKSPVNEESRLGPIHDYGLSKVIGENIFSYYVSCHESCGVIFRIPGVFGGSRENGYIFNLIKKMKNDESIEVDSMGLGYWEAINLDDLVEIIAEFLNKYPKSGKLEIFNLGYGREIDFVKTAYLVKSLLNSKSDIKVMPKDYGKFFLDNRKLLRYVSLKSYLYSKALKRYIEEIG